MSAIRKRIPKTSPALALVALMLSICDPAGASDVSTVDAGSEPETSELTRQILEEEAGSEMRTLKLLRLRASYPQQVSAGFGIMRAKQTASFDCRTVCDFRGPIFQVEPGLSGVQASVGYAHLIGETRRSKSLLQAIYVGLGYKAVVMRTYGNSPLSPEGQTLVGAEGSFTVASANFSLALLGSLTDDRSRDWIVSFGLGWGF